MKNTIEKYLFHKNEIHKLKIEIIKYFKLPEFLDFEYVDYSWWISGEEIHWIEDDEEYIVNLVHTFNPDYSIGIMDYQQGISDEYFIFNMNNKINNN